MTSQLFLELSTRLVKDLKAWSEEATRREALTPEELADLQEAAEIVDRATVVAVARSAD
jgi:Xaa-Pro aminopeptidase